MNREREVKKLGVAGRKRETGRERERRFVLLWTSFQHVTQ